jgi:hypothetical protein
MGDLLKSIQDLIKSVSKQPLMALLLVIFLVLIWVQVEKLDNINNTLLAIHEDNVRIGGYITAEREDTAKYELAEQEVQKKLEYLIALIQGKN